MHISNAEDCSGVQNLTMRSGNGAGDSEEGCSLHLTYNPGVGSIKGVKEEAPGTVDVAMTSRVL